MEHLARLHDKANRIVSFGFVIEHLWLWEKLAFYLAVLINIVLIFGLTKPYIRINA